MTELLIIAISSALVSNVVLSPVSYTHLDVYKRQPLNCAVLFNGAPEKNKGAMEDVSADRRKCFYL